MLSLDVVVRTLADFGRSALLFRALDSIQNQNGIEVRPIVVVNGDRYDPCVLEKLERRQGILLHRIPQASTGIALAEGRRLVTAPYFAYLDDDDELVADSLLRPLEWLDRNLDCDLLVTNGYFLKEGGSLSEFIHIAYHLKVGQPALSLLDDGWLAPGASLFRTAEFPKDMLAHCWDQMEWTHLAFEICAARKRLHFMDVPTVLCHDTPRSMSKALAHEEAACQLMRSVRSNLSMKREVRAKADKRYRNFLHILAMRNWQQQKPWQAWRYHLASMRPPYTFTYLLFSRKLLWPTHRRDGTSSR